MYFIARRFGVFASPSLLVVGDPEFEYRSGVVTKDPSKQNAVPYFTIGHDYLPFVIQ
jgi:hypothetical protein